MIIAFCPWLCSAYLHRFLHIRLPDAPTGLGPERPVFMPALDCDCSAALGYPEHFELRQLQPGPLLLWLPLVSMHIVHYPPGRLPARLLTNPAPCAVTVVKCFRRNQSKVVVSFSGFVAYFPPRFASRNRTFFLTVHDTVSDHSGRKILSHMEGQTYQQDHTSAC